jgi:hypothetical protein
VKCVGGGGSAGPARANIRAGILPQPGWRHAYLPAGLGDRRGAQRLVIRRAAATAVAISSAATTL